MRRFYFMFYLAQFGQSTISYAQLTHIFAQTARNMRYVDNGDVAVATNGTVFLTN